MRFHNSRESFCLAIAVGILFSALSGHAYMVGPAVSLDKMTELSDLVVKAKAISTTQATDSLLTAVQGFDRVSTKFQVISVFKGAPAGESFTFHHYAEGTNRFYFFMPQHYEFTNGRSYIVFARLTNSVFQQLWNNHTGKYDQGAFRTPDNLPLAAKSVKEACWLNLAALCKSPSEEDVAYGIHQLDSISGGGSTDSTMTLKDFPREEVIELVRPLFSSKKETVLRAAIELAGSHNPFISQDPIYWLATVGKGHLPGIGTRDAKADNPAARALVTELTTIVDRGTNTDLRALAIRAFGRSSAPEMPERLKQWAADPEPLVRQAAIALLADTQSPNKESLIGNATTDPSTEVRQGAGQAIGFGQITSLVPLLDKLLQDTSEKVRQSAAITLLSFPIATTGEVLRRNLKSSEYRILFVNALATVDPVPYLADLHEIIAKNLSPERFWGGRIPSADSWDILFKYVQARPATEAQSGKLDPSLDALEKLHWYGSSEPRDLYALYLQRGLTQRAKRFREHCRHTFSYDIDYYFKMADERPQTYTRQ